MKLVETIETCCQVLAQPALDAREATEIAEALRVLADPARLRLLSFIASSPAGEACVCELTEPIGLTQPTTSHHLKLLSDAGFLEREKRGTWAYYRLVPNALEVVRRALDPAALREPYAPKGE
ncbi:MAG: metalloregulator ArsR/SmtB family transcription factor [Actinomycetota bacterium]|nr:metalloregulator ArsR/SmtB family transcription factor [Actinomycetota bacterium]